MNRAHHPPLAPLHRSPRAARAFTLIELLVVVAIIALLMSILLPSLGKAKELANRVYCAANIRGICQSMSLYAQEGNNTFPMVAHNSGALPPLAPGQYRNAFNKIPMLTTPADLAPQLSDVDPGSPIAGIWILSLTNQAPPKMLLCKSDRSNVSPAQRVDGNGHTYPNFQDQYQISYSVLYPWSGNGIARAWQNSLSTSSPIMCDMAPLSGDNDKDTKAPRGSRRANSGNHDDQGQNVGYGDMHVDWQKDCYVSDTQENLFTVGPINNQSPVTLMNEIPFEPPSGDFVMVPVRRTSDNALAP
jgi:prepilin-type N-terminal cleavage/methylation domain-containing protein